MQKQVQNELSSVPKEFAAIVIGFDTFLFFIRNMQYFAENPVKAIAPANVS